MVVFWRWDLLLATSRRSDKRTGGRTAGGGSEYTHRRLGRGAHFDLRGLRYEPIVACRAETRGRSELEQRRLLDDLRRLRQGG